ncbi:MAG TPA: YezD family protein [Gemmataceae bacterium]|nr:YezD family protein [Gemmataceae bacterium]
MADRIVAESSRPATQDTNLRWTWQHIENALRDLQFGSITLLVQDGVVVQVERTERKRYQRSPHTPN